MSAGIVHLLLFAILTGSVSAAPQIPWLVPDAPYRTIVRVEEAARNPETGLAIELPEFGATRPDLSDVLLLDGSSKPLPLALVQRTQGDSLTLVTKGIVPSTNYHLYFGGDRSRAQSPWNPKLSLYLETRRAPVDAKADSWDAMENLWKHAKLSDGGGFVEKIWSGENPFGDSNNFVSHYTGYLVTPDGGDLYLYTISSDASFVLVNGKYEFGWPGKHGPRADATTVTGTTVHASAGFTQIDYYQCKGADGPPPAMVLGWKKQDQMEAIPAEAWLHPGTTTTTPIEDAHSGPVPIAGLEFSSYMGFGGEYFFETTCTLPDQDLQGWNVEWHFEDGAILSGTKVQRIIPGTAPQMVAIELKRGSDTIHGERKIVLPGNAPAASINSTGDVNRYVEILGRDDTAHLSPAALRRDLVLLLEGAPVQKSAPFAEAWLAKGATAADPLWIDAQLARLRARAATNPADALQELRKVDPEARRKYAARLDFLEIELLVALKDPTAVSVATQYAFQNPKSDWGKLAKVRIGDFYRISGDLKQAAERYKACDKPLPPEEAVRKAPAQDRAYAVAVTNLIENNQRTDAETKLNQWERDHPSAKLQAEFLLLEARVLMMFGRWSEALADLESFQSIQPASPYEIDARFYQARALFELGKKAEARKIWKDLAENYPNHALGASSKEWEARAGSGASVGARP